MNRGWHVMGEVAGKALLLIIYMEWRDYVEQFEAFLVYNEWKVYG